MADEQGTYVIVGAGQAGGEVAVELRKHGFAGRVVLVGDEPHVPYRRPPLSKAYLSGELTEEGLYITPAAALEKHGIEFLGGAKVQWVDPRKRTVGLADGRVQPYDKLALATGGEARALNMPGAHAANIFTIRTIGDIQRLKPLCQPAARLVIIGGGFIGLEVAAVAKKIGMKVTVLEGLPRVLARVTAPQVSEFFERVHREEGVDVRTGVQVVGLEGEERVTKVLLGNGESVSADVIVVGIGLVPGSQLAEAAGLKVDNGIVVDEYAQTSDPHIVAAGDCTNHPSQFLGRRIRLESVQNAMEQARTAARTMLGQKVPYHAVPWFWSDQYNVKMQMVGISAGFDQLVMRGDMSGRSFAAFYLREGRLIAADTVNRPHEFMFAKKLVALGTVVDPARVGDETMPLKALVANA